MEVQKLEKKNNRIRKKNPESKHDTEKIIILKKIVAERGHF